MRNEATNKSNNRLDRRRFIAGAVTAAAFTIVKPSHVRGTQANSKVEVADYEHCPSFFSCSGCFLYLSVSESQFFSYDGR